MLGVKNPPSNAGDIKDKSSIPGWVRSTGGGHDNPYPVLLFGESRGQRSLASYSPEGRKELDTSEAT